MTYQTAVEAGYTNNPHITLLFDGIPILFGTKAGLVHTFTNVANTPGFISVDAIIPGSVDLGASTLDYDRNIVPPAAGSVSIRTDPSWDRWFQRRTLPQLRLTSLMTESDTTINVSTTASIDAPDVLFCNREAMLIDTVDSGTTCTVIRNYCALPNNQAATHQAGALVATVPVHLLGRMAELRIWPSDDPADSKVLRYLRLAGSPVKDDGNSEWKFDFDDNMKMYDRKIATGFRGDQVYSIITTMVGTGDDAIPAMEVSPTNSNREFAACEKSGSLAIGFAAGGQILDIIDYSVAFPVVTNPVYLQGHPVTGGGTQSGQVIYRDVPDDDQPSMSMRRCYVFRGSPYVALLQVALSDTGLLQADSTYDVLFGVTSTSLGSAGRLESGETECRMGAAIPAALINIPAVTDPLITETVPGWCRVLLEEENFLDFASDCAAAIGGYLYLNSDQKLSIKRYAASYATDTITATIDNTSILRPHTPIVSMDDESNVIHTAAIKCNYDPFKKDFLGKVSVKDADLAETYRDIAGTIELESKGLLADLRGQRADEIVESVQGAIPADLQALITRMDRQLFRRKQVRKYTLHLPWRFSILNVGDRVRITYDLLDDFAGSSLSAFTAEIVSLKPEIKTGVIVIDVHEVLSAKLINVTCEVLSWVNPVITVAANTKWGGGANPERQFAIGWQVRILDKTAAVQYGDQSGLLTVSNIGSRTLTVTGTPGMTPAIGDLVVSSVYSEATSTVNNLAHAQAQHDYLFIADTNHELNTDVAADRWG